MRRNRGLNSDAREELARAYTQTFLALGIIAGGGALLFVLLTWGVSPEAVLAAAVALMGNVVGFYFQTRNGANSRPAQKGRQE